MPHPTNAVPGLASIALAVVLSAAAAIPDVLRLKDGRTLDGTATESGDTVTVQTQQGTVTVRKSEIQDWRKEAAPAGAEARDSETEAAGLVAAADQAVERKSYSEAKRILERVVAQHPGTAAAKKARETLATLPNALGRLVLGFDTASEARAIVLGKGGSVQVEHITDEKRVRQGAGAAHVTINSSAGATLVKFAIPEQNLERLRMVSFWMWSEAKLHQKRVMKLVLFSPGTPDSPNFFDGNIVGADANGWKLVQVQRAQFKGEGGGFAADFQNGRPNWKKIDGIGFLLPVENYRDFILDDVRILE